MDLNVGPPTEAEREAASPAGEAALDRVVEATGRAIEKLSGTTRVRLFDKTGLYRIGQEF